MMRSMLLSALLFAAPAAAAPHAKAHHAAPKSSTAKSKIHDQVPDFQAVAAIMDKFFPAQPDPDPARLALARTSAAALWPDGAYGKMFDGFINQFADRALQMKISDFADLDGKKSRADANPAEANLSVHDTLATEDPYFDQRVAAIRAAVTEQLGVVSAVVDPRFREGLARTMARRFDGQQLTDLNRFLATPSGRAIASQYSQLWLDPDMMRSIFNSMPDMMKLMPGVVEKVGAAYAQFPEPPKKPKGGKH